MAAGAREERSGGEIEERSGREIYRDRVSASTFQAQERVTAARSSASPANMAAFPVEMLVVAAAATPFDLSTSASAYHKVFEPLCHSVPSGRTCHPIA